MFNDEVTLLLIITRNYGTVLSLRRYIAWWWQSNKNRVSTARPDHNLWGHNMFPFASIESTHCISFNLSINKRIFSLTLLLPDIHLIMQILWHISWTDCISWRWRNYYERPKWLFLSILYEPISLPRMKRPDATIHHVITTAAPNYIPIFLNCHAMQWFL